MGPSVPAKGFFGTPSVTISWNFFKKDLKVLLFLRKALLATRPLQFSDPFGLSQRLQHSPGAREKRPIGPRIDIISLILTDEDLRLTSRPCADRKPVRRWATY